MTGTARFLEDAVLGIVHMHVLRGVKDDVGELLVANFKEDEIKEARDMLEETLWESRGGH